MSPIQPDQPIRTVGHIAALDGVRGLAILLVIGGHTDLIPHIAGVVGVTVFFVLSGFLITNVLLGRERSLRSFYGARVARLFPAMAIVVIAIGAVWIGSGRGFSGYVDDAAVTLLYAENFAHSSYDGHILSHTWSLCVEEQFYLIWPFLLPALMRTLPRRRAAILAFAIGILALARVVAGATGHVFVAYASLPTNAFSMLSGCALAALPRRRVRGAKSIGLVVVAACIVIGDHMPAPGTTVPVVAVAGATLLVLGAIDDGGMLTSARFRFVGRISYAWYLWHWPLLWLTGDVEARWRALPIVALSFGLAVASTFLIEEPLRERWRKAARLRELSRPIAA